MIFQDGSQVKFVKGERIWECLLSQGPVVGKENALAALKLKKAWY